MSLGSSGLAPARSFATAAAQTLAWALAEKADFGMNSSLLIVFSCGMSNSGGSWGPDGKLYITGHDNTELYAMELPKMGSVLRWSGTVPVDLAGQGFAFDRSESGMLYGIIRRPGNGSEVTVSRIPLRQP